MTANKKIIFIFLAAVMLGKAILPAAVLALSEETVVELDLGKIETEGSVSGQIILSAPIRTAVALCDCLSFTIFREKGESRLEIVFDPRGYQGETWQELIAVDDYSRKTRIRVHAFVEKSAGGIAGESRSDSDKFR